MENILDAFLPNSGATFLFYALIPAILALLTWGSLCFAQFIASFWPKSKDPVSTKTTYRCGYIALINSVLTGMVGAFGVYFQRYYSRLSPDTLEELLSVTHWIEISFWVAIMIHLYDLPNYFYHRYAHANKWLYKTSHSIHHELQYPNGPYAGIYADPLEFVITDLIGFLPTFFVPASVVAAWIYLFSIAFLVQFAHSGHDVEFGWIFSAKFHRNHHKFRTVNYAEYAFLYDWLFNTYYIGD